MTATLSTTGEGGAADQTIDLPVIHKVVMSNGAEFLVRSAEGIWRTEVVTLPDRYSGEMRVGDIIVGHVASNTRMDGPFALKDSLEADIIAGATSTRLAVQQGGQMWVVTFSLPN